ncbi:MAG: hypothetical protein LBE48_01365 [Methanomassiliicoccaceae archaeon]|jgi:hypothetical protein|nr:hypothetical protein [Methanomassiliicoccaceae archaeon]
MAWFKIDKTKYARYSMMPGAAEQAPAAAYGNTQLGKALTKASDILSAREKAGKIKAATAKGYKTRIDGLVPLIGKDEDSGLLQVAQIIGAINRAI